MAAKTYTTREVAKQIGVSRQTLQAWIAGGKIEAPDSVEIGRAAVRFWTRVDIERLRKFKGTLKPGRKPKG
jgi:excisionase family DNA binding protein